MKRCASHVLTGARERCLSKRCVRMIEDSPVFEESNKQRERTEHAVHEVN